MPLFSCGIFSTFIFGSPTEKMHAHPRSHFLSISNCLILKSRFYLYNFCATSIKININFNISMLKIYWPPERNYQRTKTVNFSTPNTIALQQNQEDIVQHRQHNVDDLGKNL